MTDRAPMADQLPEEREEVGIPSAGVVGSAATTASGAVPTAQETALVVPDLELAYESGVEVKARSQWAYARIRFFRHRMAVASLVVLILVSLVAIFANRVAPYGYDDLDLNNIASGPTFKDHHLFGTDLLGRDYLSRVIFGIRTSLWVAIFVAVLSTLIGTTLGAIAGYYGGQTDNLLMRFTDLILTLPALAVLLVAAKYLGQSDSQIGPFTLTQPEKVALILAFLFWTGLARIVRGVFLSLREKEFVEASHPSELRGPDRRNDDPRRRACNPHRGCPLLPRLRDPATASGARKPDRGRGVERLRHLVARDLPRARDRPGRALHQLHRRRPPRCTRSDPAKGTRVSG
jgi:N-terminal TM domain of oligopeptide transport permease C/Binding-protein-dependent transport system inner membrane component